MPLKIAIDLDNVVITTTETLISFINERLPVNLKMEDITSYSIEAALPQQYRWIVDCGFRSKDMWREVQVMPYAANIIKQLYDEGHEIFFATSSLPENLRKKINHLSRNMHLPKDYVERHTININDKYLLNVDVLIDDCPEHIGNAKRNYYSVVFDYPWNRGNDIDKLPCVTRVKDWIGAYEAIKIIESLIKENENDDVTP